MIHIPIHRQRPGRRQQSVGRDSQGRSCCSAHRSSGAQYCERTRLVSHRWVSREVAYGVPGPPGNSSSSREGSMLELRLSQPRSALRSEQASVVRTF